MSVARLTPAALISSLEERLPDASRGCNFNILMKR
jgi:hypothetical protein